MEIPPQRNFVRLKKMDEKSTKDALSTSAQLVRSLDKTARKAYYLGGVSLVLLRILKSRSKKKQRALRGLDNNETTEEDLVSWLSRVVGDWREYLLWLEDGLSILSLVMKSQQMELILTESQVQTIINTTKTIQIIMKSVQSVLNFVVLTKVLMRKAASIAFGGRFSGILWFSAIVFAYTQLKDIWPQLELKSAELWQVVSSVMTFLKGPLKGYMMELLEDIEETNPELFQRLHEKLQNIEAVVTVPKLLVQKSSEVLQFTGDKAKPLFYQYILPHIQNILIKSYQTYLQSKEGITNFSTGDVLALLSQYEWSQELMGTLLRYFFWLKTSFSPQKSKSKL